MTQSIPLQTLKRLPAYLQYLKSQPKGGADNVSAGQIAAALSLGEIQVRKDLAMISAKGRPKIGYIREDLKGDLEFFLGYSQVDDAVLVGAGRLGRALLSYEGFKEYGLNIVAAFDTDARAAGREENGIPILPAEKMGGLCRRMNIRIGIITVPAAAAQEVCDSLVACGVLAVWNFTPSHLRVAEHILVRSENMAASLAMLSRHLEEKLCARGQK